MSGCPRRQVMAPANTFPTLEAALAWLMAHNYRPRSWGAARAAVWVHYSQHDHIATVSQDLAGRWTVDEHQKD